MKNRLFMTLTLLTLWSGFCSPGADATAVNSLLNNASPTWNRISDRSGNPDSANDNLPYQVLEIRSATGAALTATMGASTQFDSFLALYSSSILSNPLAADDDSGGYPLAQLNNVPLSANTSYYLVVLLAVPETVPSLGVRLKVVATVLPGATWLAVGWKTSACSLLVTVAGLAPVRV